MSTLSFLFYPIGFIFIAFELLMFLGLQDAFSFQQETKRELNNSKGSLHNLSTSQKTYMYFTLFYLLWTFIGLFTFQWQAFLLFLLYSAIKKNNFWFFIIDTLVSSFFVLFLIVNGLKYHIHPNIFF